MTVPRSRKTRNYFREVENCGRADYVNKALLFDKKEIETYGA